MTITASLRQSTPLRADLPAATLALAQIVGHGPQLDYSASINKVALHWIYLPVRAAAPNSPSVRPAVTATAPLPDPNPHSTATSPT